MDAATTAGPEPEVLDEWPCQQHVLAGPLSGVCGAMAMQTHDAWQVALAFAGFRDWLAGGAPGDDARSGRDQGLDLR